MTIGLVLLAVVAILIFFGLAGRFFKNMGVPEWLGFIIALALIVGAVIPNISIGSGFVMNIGGFIIPVIGMTVLAFFIGANWDLARMFFAELSVAAVAVATRALILPNTSGNILASTLIVGFIGGAVAFIIARSRVATLASVMGGVVLGDLIVNFIYVYGIGGYVFSMGTRGVFDSIIVGCVFGILLLEAVVTARRVTSSKRVASSTLNTESGEDVGDDFDDYFDDTVM